MTKKQVMLDNMIISLFNSSEVEVHACDIQCNKDIDVEVFLKNVMKKNFTIMVKLSKTINSNMMASIRKLARRNT